MTYAPTSLVDILRWRAKNQPHRLAYRFLVDGEFEEVTLTYEELDRRARSIGALLQSSAMAGDRALLLFPPGLDFIAAYFGCLYARVMGIPTPPPHPARLERSVPVILRIAADAQPSVALLSSSLFDAIMAQNAISRALGNIKLLVTDNDERSTWAENWQQPAIGGNDIAFLQYTSGSTTAPKGVMISHDNLMHNLSFIQESFGATSQSQTVFWLPPYHDMGLIGGILQALYTGYPVILMPHLMFLQRPLRWLQAISRFQATVSGGPNFAYDLCLRKIKSEHREQLDLRTWEVAFNGAEPVYHKTLEQFADYFAPCGFRREAFLPCYGLAEATLMVTGGPRYRPPVLQNLLHSGLERHQAIIAPEKNEDTRTLVSCGQSMPGQQIRIVDPETLTLCTGGQIGEIWLNGPCVASGYWNNPLETAHTFGARLPNNPEGPFLRTGDLGVLHEGELYITGRIKNLIIIDGKNHYPHDIERTVEASHSALQPGGCAVFSVDKEGSERVVVIAEMPQKLAANTSEVVQAIRQAVAEQHELSLHDIKLTLPGSIPKTTSGKTRYFLCKKDYLSGTLKEINLP